MRTPRSHSACVPTIIRKARELNQFCSAFCFPQKTEETKETKNAVLDYKRGTGCSEKCERDASKLWSIQSPHLKPPIFLDVILSVDNRPASYRSHSRDAEQGRVGGGRWCALAMCGALIRKHTGGVFFFFFLFFVFLCCVVLLCVVLCCIVLSQPLIGSHAPSHQLTGRWPAQPVAQEWTLVQNVAEFTVTERPSDNDLGRATGPCSGHN